MKTRQVTQKEYEQNELNRVRVEIERVEKESLTDRQESALEFKELLTENYDHFSDHLDHLFDGNLGFGAKLKVDQIRALSKRSNKNAMIFQLVAALGYRVTQHYTNVIYKKADKALQDKLNEDIKYYLESDLCMCCSARTEISDMIAANKELICEDCHGGKYMTTQGCLDSFREAFFDGDAKTLDRAYEDDRDMTAEAWNNYTDSLCKDDHITDEQYNDMEAIDDLI